VELVVFRFILLPSDLPVLSETDGGVLKYAPGQTGVYRIRNEISAPYNINKQGWNSGHASYEVENESQKPRICIIGDSYVEALQVPHTESFAELIESYLAPDIDSVYRFGLSGAPLSQYLFILNDEVLQYSPRIVVVNMVPNDFLESVVSGGGTYWTSFARLDMSGSTINDLKSPEPYQRPASWWAKGSTIYRYLWVRQQIRPQLVKAIWLRLFQEKGNGDSIYSGNIRTDTINDRRIPLIIDYVFAEFRKIERANNLKILLVLDANREFAKDSHSGKNIGLAPLNEIVRHYAQINKLDFIDLTETFSDDYSKYKVPFSFPHDGHWNGYAHRLVAKTVGTVIGEKYLYD